MEYLFSPTHANIHNVLPVNEWEYHPVPVHQPLTLPERTHPLLATLGVILLGAVVIASTMLALTGGLILFTVMSALIK